MKQADCDECWSSQRMKPDEAIAWSIERALIAYTVLIDEKPEIVFGIRPVSLLGTDAVIWMLSSDRINDIGFRFARHSRRYINYFLEYYKNLYNYVSIDNKVSIAWLRMLGAKFDEAFPYGIDRDLFMRFSFS